MKKKDERDVHEQVKDEQLEKGAAMDGAKNIQKNEDAVTRDIDTEVRRQGRRDQKKSE